MAKEKEITAGFDRKVQNTRGRAKKQAVSPTEDAVKLKRRPKSPLVPKPSFKPSAKPSAKPSPKQLSLRYLEGYQRGTDAICLNGIQTDCRWPPLENSDFCSEECTSLATEDMLQALLDYQYVLSYQ